MARIRSLARLHAVPLYFGLVFLLSWGGGLLVLAPSRLPLSAEEFTSLGLVVYLAIIAGPSLSGITMIAVADGMSGIRDFLARLRRWRIAPMWYALALVPALATSAATLALAFLLPESRPTIVIAEDRSAVLIAAIVPSIMVGFFEEIGWTGFAVPRLRARHSILVTGLIVGAVWGAWHFPMFWEEDSLLAAFPFAILLARLFAWLPPFRVLLIWIHERTGSLPVVMLMHAAVAYAAIVFAPSSLTGASLLIAPLLSAATMWLLVGAVGSGGSGRTLPGSPAARPSALSFDA